MADQLYQKKDFYGASIWYEKALEEDPTMLNIVYKCAESYRQQNSYEKASKHYYYLIKNDKNGMYPLASYWYPMLLKNMGKYSIAKKFFKRGLRSFSGDTEGYHHKKMKHEISACETAIRLKAMESDISISPFETTINTEQSEWGATQINDSTLVFSSLRHDAQATDKSIPDTTNYRARLFESSRMDQQWNQGKALPSIINSPLFNVGNGSFNPKNNQFYFSKCDQDLKCKIYASTYKNGGWQQPHEVSALNATGFSSTQPWSVMINDKEVIFFSSDRKGGIGKMDIWFSIKQPNGTFSTPTNAGSTINSIDNEITPFYNTVDSTLYFSSDWHEGLGGFDIFKSKTMLQNFSAPKNLGAPINSPANDMYYNSFDDKAMFTSNRGNTSNSSTCCNDVYHFTLPKTTENLPNEMDELRSYLPIKLYFHNDRPNPKTLDTTSNLNYMTTYIRYNELYETYIKAYTKGLKNSQKEDAQLEIDDLFEEHIRKGAEHLKQIPPLLLKPLQKGKKLTLTIKGFASPLSKSEYNINLTLRRVATLINYLKEYDEGILLPYITGTATNGGELNFIKVPFGEYQATNNVSDNIHDKRNSIYSKKAALERKIEIIAVTENSNTTIVGDDVGNLPQLTFKDSTFIFEENQYNKKVKFINNSDATLKIYDVTVSNTGFSILFPKKDIDTYEIDYVSISYLPEKVKPGVYYITFMTNTIPNQIRKRIVVY